MVKPIRKVNFYLPINTRHSEEKLRESIQKIHKNHPRYFGAKVTFDYIKAIKAGYDWDKTSEDLAMEVIKRQKGPLEIIPGSGDRKYTDPKLKLRLKRKKNGLTVRTRGEEMGLTAMFRILNPNRAAGMSVIMEDIYGSMVEDLLLIIRHYRPSKLQMPHHPKKSAANFHNMFKPTKEHRQMLFKVICNRNFRLSALDLTGHDLKLEDLPFLLMTVRKLKQIKTLTLNHNDLKGELLQELIRELSARDPKVDLDIANNPIGAFIAAAFVRFKAKQGDFIEINLKTCSLGLDLDLIIKALYEILEEPGKTIKQLNLSSNSITNAQFSKLLELLKNPKVNIDRLDISDNNIKREGLEALVDCLQENPNVKAIDVSQNGYLALTVVDDSEKNVSQDSCPKREVKDDSDFIQKLADMLVSYNTNLCSLKFSAKWKMNPPACMETINQVLERNTRLASVKENFLSLKKALDNKNKMVELTQTIIYKIDAMKVLEVKQYSGNVPPHLSKVVKAAISLQIEILEKNAEQYFKNKINKDQEAPAIFEHLEEIKATVNDDNLGITPKCF